MWPQVCGCLSWDQGDPPFLGRLPGDRGTSSLRPRGWVPGWEGQSDPFLLSRVGGELKASVLSCLILHLSPCPTYGLWPEPIAFLNGGKEVSDREKGE